MILVVNGKFDLIHAGHFNLLSEARCLAGHNGKVIVAIDSDRRIAKSNQGLGPIIGEKARAANIKVLKFGFAKIDLVDEVKVFTTDEELLAIIRQSNMMIKGSDWMGKEIIGQGIVPIKFVKVNNDNDGDKLSSSYIKALVLKKFNNEC